MGDREGHARQWCWNFNVTLGLCSVALGLALFFVTPYEVERPRLLFGQVVSGLDPDFFPRFVACLTALFGGLLIWQARSIKETNALLDLDREAITNVLFTAVTLAAFAYLLPRLGFVLASIILIAVLSTFYGNRSWLLGLGISIGVPLLFYNVLRLGLQVVLPQNPIFPDVLWF